jgi:hypothetical protein
MYRFWEVGPVHSPWFAFTVTRANGVKGLC